MIGAVFPAVPPVAWAVLDVYARTPKGRAAPELRAALERGAPDVRARGLGVTVARAHGLLDGRGRLTPAGEAAARDFLARLDREGT